MRISLSLLALANALSGRAPTEKGWSIGDGPRRWSREPARPAVPLGERELHVPWSPAWQASTRGSLPAHAVRAGVWAVTGGGGSAPGARGPYWTLYPLPRRREGTVTVVLENRLEVAVRRQAGYAGRTLAPADPAYSRV